MVKFKSKRYFISEEAKLRLGDAPKKSFAWQQYKAFKRLIEKAERTEFGRLYCFDQIATAEYDIALFRKNVPVFTYERLYHNWWRRVKRGDKDTVWPGRISHFALSSGTSSGSSKFIPVSNEMIKSYRNTAFRQWNALRKFNIPSSVLLGEALLIGGSTTLSESNERYFGDMSGILAHQAVPDWLGKRFCRPGKNIAAISNWDDRLWAIVKEAPSWNITVVCGMPNWVDTLFQKIIEYHSLNTIHDIWPNFKLYIHGGVSIQHYQKKIRSHFAEEVIFVETYMASEGFFGYTTAKSQGAFKLQSKKDVFYEFIPFNDENFNEKGELNATPFVVYPSQIKENVPYALLVSNNSGAWRYLMGDVIEFTNVEKGYVRLLGRISYSINLCGEHVSTANLLNTWSQTCTEFGLNESEFTVYPQMLHDGYRHHWIIAGHKSWSMYRLEKTIDKYLSQLNDDYAEARKLLIKLPKVTIVRSHVLRNWMSKNNTIGGQSKLPLVINSKQWESLSKFLPVVEEV